jgi:lysophospholipase L1-like esterase
MSRKVLWISICINIITIALLITIISRNFEDYYQKWIKYTHSADIVMFGDSFTEGGNWNSLIDNGPVLRKAWSGYTSSQLAGMISRTISYNPKIVFILCGGNDIRSRCFSVEFTVSNYKIMADTLRSNNIIPVFQKLLYHHNNPKINSSIDSINVGLTDFCLKEKIDLIDIGKNMYDSTGLKAELTSDGFHLNKKGYKMWAKIIDEYLEVKYSK